MSIPRYLNRDLSRADLREILDVIFIYVLVCECMEREGNLSSSQRRDLNDFYTISKLSIDSVVSAARNDIGILLSVFLSKERFEILANYNKNVNLLRYVGKFIPKLRKYFNYRLYEVRNENLINQILIELERDLVIQTQDYISVRRMIIHWEDLSLENKKIVSTRLLQAIHHRSRSGRFELQYLFDRWVATNRYELHDVTINAETGEPIHKESVGEKIVGNLLAAIVGGVLGYKFATRKKN